MPHGHRLGFGFHRLGDNSPLAGQFKSNPAWVTGRRASGAVPQMALCDRTSTHCRAISGAGYLAKRLECVRLSGAFLSARGKSGDESPHSKTLSRHFEPLGT